MSGTVIVFLTLKFGEAFLAVPTISGTL